MNPLFKNASRALKAAIRAEFRAGEVGRLIATYRRREARKGGVKRFQRFVARKLHGALAGNTVAPLPGFDRYAKKTAFAKFIDDLHKSGPLGALIGAIMRPQGRALTGNQEQEVNVAIKLAEAFGHMVVRNPGGRGGKSAQIQALNDRLAEHGLKVVPSEMALGLAPFDPTNPTTSGGTPTRPHGLPGWAERAKQQQAPTPAPNRPVRSRKTLDIDFGSGQTRRVRLDDPILTGEMIHVVSSNVHSIGFNIHPQSPVIGTLKVRFYQTHKESKFDPGPLYYYMNVPTALFRKFQSAASKGRWVWDNLRVRGTVSGHKFDYHLEMVSRGYVPRKATAHPEGEAFVQRNFLGYSKKTGEHRLLTSKLPDEIIRRKSSMTRPDNGRPDNGRRPGPNRGR